MQSNRAVIADHTWGPHPRDRRCVRWESVGLDATPLARKSHEELAAINRTVLVVCFDPAREHRMSFQACIHGAPGCWDLGARPAVLAAHENQRRGNDADRQ